MFDRLKNRGLWFFAFTIWGSVLGAATTETWLRVKTPEFTVLTPLKQKEAVTWASEFAQFIAAMRGFFVTGQRSLTPLTVVIFARERNFENYRPLGADGKPEDVAGFFARHEA